ncbi:DUF5753 domain-containing protein [Streptomyces sp. NPDC051320]|uniref:DUF5753 domain-containing protein n=1 Tax=Streptomyces sp. NPDC051320 TaxID=3154644 RepID=UPI003443239F
MAHTVPGLLQTESYARSLLEAARPSVGDRLGEMLAARLARQSILAQPESPVLWAVLDEAVLRRRVGGAVVMHEQLGELLRTATDMGQVTVQVMPFDEEEHPLLGGSLTVLSFSRRPDVADLQSSHSGELVEQPATLAEYSLAFDHLQARALSPRDSACMIRSAMEDICHDARLPTRTQRRRLAQVQPQQHPGRRLRRGR